MWPFSRVSNSNSQKTLLEIWETVESLQREQKNLRLEWNNAYDKLNSMMARMARRAESMHKNAEDEGKLYPERESSSGTSLSPSEILTLERLGPAQRRIQMQILMKRKQMNGGGGN